MVDVPELPQDEVEVRLLLGVDPLPLETDRRILVRRDAALVLGAGLGEEVRLEARRSPALREGVGMDRHEDPGSISLYIGGDLAPVPNLHEGIVVPDHMDL